LSVKEESEEDETNRKSRFVVANRRWV